MHTLKDKTVLIIGAGHVGEACAIKVLSQGLKRLILHTLTQEEALHVKKRLEKYSRSEQSIELSWGDILVTASLSKIENRQMLQDQAQKKELLDFYYAPKSETILKSSAFYQVVNQHKPDIIIDSINTATVVGYKNDPYSLARSILSDPSKECDTFDLLLANPIPPMIRFTQTLEYLMKKEGVKSYIKVSTTGLGGMGVNLPYTHGDLNEPGMSSGILGKVAASGIMHQLFWSLAHTPDCNIKVVVPAALIGWQHVDSGKFRSHGSSLQKVKIPNFVSLTKEHLADLKSSQVEGDDIEIAYVDSGENNAYSLHEMMTITALGQMEAITREEVADAVLESIYGSTKYDILTALDFAAMGPSYAAAIQREHVFEHMRSLEKENVYPSIATNNLGPTVSKHLFELYILIASNPGFLKDLLSLTAEKITNNIEAYLEKNPQIIEYALSLKLPFIRPNGEAAMIENAFVPGNSKLLKEASLEQVEAYIQDGWVDLRPKNISYWCEKIQTVLEEVETIPHDLHIPLERNWQNIKEGNIGELLGYIYSMNGGHRKKEIKKIV